MKLCSYPPFCDQVKDVILNGAPEKEKENEEVRCTVSVTKDEIPLVLTLGFGKDDSEARNQAAR